MDNKAQNEYKQAEKYALAASVAINKSRNARLEWEELDERLTAWENKMSTAPTLALTVAFVIVCIVEYIISRELYRVLTKSVLLPFPIDWIIALGFIAIAIFLSEMLVLLFSQAKRDWKFYELRRDVKNDQESEETTWNKVFQARNSRAIIGVIGSVLMLSVLFYLSWMRATIEINAGLRTTPFGVQDLLPVILYAVEIFCGIFIPYLFKKWSLNWKRKSLNNIFHDEATKCSKQTSDAINKYGAAEKLNYDAIAYPVNDNLHEAFFRSDQRDITNPVDYVRLSQNKEEQVSFHFKDSSGNPLMINVDIISDFKFTDSGATNNQGNITLKVTTYPGDSVRDLRVGTPNNLQMLHRSFAFGPTVHTVIL